MKQFGNVFCFEFLGYVRSKPFYILTIVFCVLIALLLSVPAIIGLFDTETEPEPGDVPVNADELPVMAVSDMTGAPEEEIDALFRSLFPNNKIVIANATQSALEEAVHGGKYEFAVVLQSPSEYVYIASNIGMYDMTDSLLSSALSERYRMTLMEEGGLDRETAAGIISAFVTGRTVTTGKDQMQSYFYTYILIFLLYFAVIMYGQLVSTSVATEKSSRAMEVLITSTSPNSLIFGKVLGSGAAGLLQMVLLLGTAFTFFNINKQYWDGNGIISSIFDIPVSLMIYVLIFFLFGFFIYAFLYGALGSLASRLEDINTLVLPITFLFIIAFMVVMISISSGSVDNAVMKIASFIPLTSPMAMFARIAMGEVAFWEIALSIGLLASATIGVGLLSAWIYRIGVLLYGNPPKLGELFRILKNSRRN